MDKNLDIKLANFLRAKAGEAEWAIRYRPNFFLGMLETNGGYLTVIKLLSANCSNLQWKTVRPAFSGFFDRR